jgi:hypothetical protein
LSWQRKDNERKRKKKKKVKVTKEEESGDWYDTKGLAMFREGREW